MKKDIFYEIHFYGLIEIRELSLKYRDLYTKDQNIIEENGYMYMYIIFLKEIQ